MDVLNGLDFGYRACPGKMQVNLCCPNCVGFGEYIWQQTNFTLCTTDQLWTSVLHFYLQMGTQSSLSFSWRVLMAAMKLVAIPWTNVLHEQQHTSRKIVWNRHPQKNPISCVAQLHEIHPQSSILLYLAVTWPTPSGRSIRSWKWNLVPCGSMFDSCQDKQSYLGHRTALDSYLSSKWMRESMAICFFWGGGAWGLLCKQTYLLFTVAGHLATAVIGVVLLENPVIVESDDDFRRDDASGYFQTLQWHGCKKNPQKTEEILHAQKPPSSCSFTNLTTIYTTEMKWPNKWWKSLHVAVLTQQPTSAAQMIFLAVFFSIVSHFLPCLCAQDMT